MDYLKQLNPAQLEAVKEIDRPVLVIAGAGSGKTMVIENKVAYLVDKGIPAQSILLLTFTRRAANNMIDRASAKNSACRKVEGGTFHSFAYKILIRYGSFLGFNQQLTILDEDDSQQLIGRLIKNLSLNQEKKLFPKKETLRRIFSYATNKEVGIREILEKEYPHFLEFEDKIKKLRQIYQEAKIKKNYLDYDDLLLYLKILLENKEVAQILSKKYRYIMVDEYQDTNKLQGEITYLLSKDNRKILVVGDDAQSIYGFRGATHENIMTFPHFFPECRIIKLEENYRSTQMILDLANVILTSMKFKYQKTLFSSGKRIGNRPVFLQFKSIDKEADWVADKILELRNQGIPLIQQAVLFRSAFISLPLQASLASRGIPFKLFGGLRFYETAHIKDILSYLRLLVNPKDELAWERILELFPGIGERNLTKIISQITNYSSFKSIIEELKKISVNSKPPKNFYLLNLSEALDKAYKANLVLDKLKIVINHYQPFFKEKFDDWLTRENDILVLEDVAGSYQSLEKFLSDFTLESPEVGVEGVDSKQNLDDYLNLSTIHSAKGLEWQVVFIIGLIEGVLPSGYCLKNEDDLEEEHRLFYVGVTRAKSELYLSVHHLGSSGGITRFNKISRFLETPIRMGAVDMEINSDFTISDSYILHDRGSSSYSKRGYTQKKLIKKVRDFFGY